MKHLTKRTSIALILALLISVISISLSNVSFTETANATDYEEHSSEEFTPTPPDPDATSGICCNNLKWFYDSETKTLTLSLANGEQGQIGYFSYDGYTPWHFLKDKIETIEVNEGINTIHSYAFTNCTALKKVILGKDVLKVYNKTFEGSSSFTEYVVSEDNPNFITKNGVLYSKDETVIHAVPTGTKGKFIITENIKQIESSAFSACEQLTEVYAEDGIEEIKDFAFYECTALKTINFPESLQSIGECAFYGCKELKEVTILSNVTKIGYGSFGVGRCECGLDTFYNVTLTVEVGSEAEKYAKTHSFNLKYINYLEIPEHIYYLDNETLTAPNFPEKYDTEAFVNFLNGIASNAEIKSSNAYFATGDTIVYNEKEYTVIISGDVDENGIIDATDYLKIKRAFLQTMNLTDTQFKAADMDGNNIIDSTDYLQVKKYFLSK